MSEQDTLATKHLKEKKAGKKQSELTRFQLIMGIGAVIAVLVSFVTISTYGLYFTIAAAVMTVVFFLGGRSNVLGRL